MGDFVSRTNIGTLEAEVTLVDGPRTEFVIQAERGVTGGLQTTQKLTLPREKGDVIGSRWLLFFADDGMQSRLQISSSGTVSCEGSSPAFVIPVQDANDLFVRADCPEAIRTR